MEPRGRARVAGPDVHDHLVPLAGRPVAGEPGERRVRHPHERIGPRDPDGAVVLAGLRVASMELGVPAGLEPLLDDRSELGVEVGPAAPAAVVPEAEADLVAVIPVVGSRFRRRVGAGVIGGRGLEGVLLRHLVELCDRRLSGERSELLVVRRRHVGHDLVDLVLRQGPGVEGRGGRRQLLPPTCHADDPPRPGEREPGLPGEPVGRRPDAGLLPRARLQGLGDELHQPGGRGVQQPGHGSDPLLQGIDGRRRWRGSRSCGRRPATSCRCTSCGGTRRTCVCRTCRRCTDRGFSGLEHAFDPRNGV